jgi:4-amino-4-deoxy-L-arabinose transferase-like glycosyltransferase
MPKIYDLITQNWSDRKILWILFLAAIFLWSIGLGDLPLRDWDEGYYGTVAKDMFRQGTWLHPTYLGKPFLDQPPFIFWVIHLSYNLLGINEFTTRLPTAFLTACSVPLLYLVGREIFNNRSPAIFSALVYLTLLPVVRLGKLAMMDGMINTFLIFSLLCLLKSRRESYWGIGLGIGLGLLTLTKGLLVLALGFILLVFSCLNKFTQLLKNPYLYGGLILGFTPVVFWYVAQINHYGQEFIRFNLQQYGFNRLLKPLHGNKGASWYYFIELLKYSIPWLLFFPGSIYLAWQKRNQTWANLVLIGIVIYLGTISLMATKLPWYIMPLYPFFAIAVGAYLAELWQTKKQYPLILAIFLLILGFAALGGCVYFIIKNSDISLIALSIVLAITMFLGAGKIKENNHIFIPILLAGVYTTLGLFFLSPDWLWELNEAFPVKPVAALIKNYTPEQTVVYTSFRYSRPSLDFYSERRVTAVEQAELEELSKGKNYLLLEESALESLPLLKSNSRILGATEKFTLVLSK